MDLHKVLAVAAVWLTCSFSAAQRSTPVQVVPPSGAASDRFGSVVAIDGDTMVVGAPGTDVGGRTNQGSALVYRWSGSGWNFEASLIAAGGVENDQFGCSVSISGDTILVGSKIDSASSSSGQGSAFVFVRAGTSWTQQARLTAACNGSNAQFGCTVSIFGDTAVVGAPSDDVGVNVDQGSAFIFQRTGSTWRQQARLNAAGGMAGDLFGCSVAISGDIAIVGAAGGDVAGSVDQGTAFVFARSDGSWSQRAALAASGGQAGDRFGASVALWGGAVVVGAPGDDVGLNIDQGSACIFTTSGDAWSQQTQLVASSGASGDQFGTSVAIAADTVVVGAAADDVGSAVDQGSVHVFVRDGTAWKVQAQFGAPLGAAGDRFGASVAIFGDTAIVGTDSDDVGANVDQGSVWVLSRLGSSWIGPDLSSLAAGGAAGDLFGSAVAVSGDTAIVGAYSDDVGANVNQGSAYIFVRVDSAWIQQAQLTASNGAANDQFGYSVAISGDTAVVGANTDDVGSNADQGSAYVFVRSGTTWTQQSQLTATGGAAGDQFGVSVGISGSTIVVGASLDDVGANTDQGSAYVFARSGTTWTQQAQLNGTGGAASDLFGISVAISADSIVVGATGDDVGTNSNQGSAFIFVRAGTGWSQQAQLNAIGGVGSDSFGVAVALSGETVIIGASGDDVASNTDQGSAYVFVRSGTTWKQQAQLTAAAGMANDQFGAAVAIAGDTALIGAYADDVGSNADQGSAFIFTRVGSAWIQQLQLNGVSGAAGDQFGKSVAISGVAAIVGANADDVGGNVNQGSIWTCDVHANDLPLAYNAVADVVFASLPAAMLSAQSGHQLLANDAAWRMVTVLDTTGRSLILGSLGAIRTSPQSILTLGGSSSLVANSGSVIDLNGQLRVNAFGDLYADAVLLGSRGILTARSGSSLSINSPVVAADGQTRLEQAATLTAMGDWTNIGSVSLGLDASFLAGGTLRSIDAWTMSAGASVAAGVLIDNRATWNVTAGEINAPLFANQGSVNAFGSSVIYGSFMNNVGATTTVRSGTLFVFGDFTNNGTVIGTICSTCSGLPPGMDVGGTLSLGPAANLTMPFVGSIVHIGGSFDCAINANTRFDMALSTLQMESARSEVTLEVMSRDIGVDALGLDRSRPGHFPIGELHIGGAPTTVRLVDAYDNALDGTGACEALYVDTLRIDAGSRLINTTCRVYYNTLVNAGTVDAPENLIPLQGTPCPADFNMDGGVDGGDVVDFFAAWEAGESTADVNLDGGVDGGDIDVFFAAWEAGGC
ncbi:MAG: FG-GAP repeat protein [Phycisphaerae bacterium]